MELPPPLVEMILQNMEEGVIICDAEGKLIFANRAFGEMVGWDVEKLLRKPLPSLIKPVGRPLLFLEAIESTLKKGHWQGEAEIRVGGERKVILATAAPIFGMDREKDLGVALIVGDITQRRVMEEEIQRRNRELSLVYDLLILASGYQDWKAAVKESLAKILSILHSEAGAVFLWDEEKKGLGLQLSLGLTYKGERDLDEEAKRKDSFHRVYQSGESWLVEDVHSLRRKFTLQGKRGELESLLAVPMVSGEKKIGVVMVAHRQKKAYTYQDVQSLIHLAAQVGVVFELRELVQTLKSKVDELERERDFTHTIVENIPSALFLLDPQGKIEFITRRAKEILHYEGSELVGKNFSLLLHPKERARVRRDTSSLQAARTVFLESRMVEKGGQEVWVELGFAPRPFEEGKFRGLLVIVSDLSDRRKKEEEVKLREVQLESLSQRLEGAHRIIEHLNEKQRTYLTMVHHELAHPLYLIKEEIKELRTGREGMDEEEIEERIELINRTVQRIERLVQDLGNVNQVEKGELELRKEWSNLCNLSSQVMSEMSLSAPHHIIRLSMPDEEIYGMIDEDRVEQVLFNLMENAVKFSPEGSEITLVLEKIGKDKARWRVVDQGPGMTPEQVKRALARAELGVEKDYPSQGLGLFICNDIISAHGGNFHIESQPGKGTAISFTVPLT